MSRRRNPPQAAPPSAPERSVLDLVAEIKSGATDPKLMAPADRQACVGYLAAEGLSVPEIAQFLKHSDRTITRDRRAVQEAAALSHDPQLSGRVAGQLVQEAALCIDRIRRVSRDRETPPAVKVDAERGCWEILSSLVQRLQGLGYLPTASQKVEADVTHHAGEIPSLDEIQGEVRRLREIGQTAGEPSPEILELEQAVTRASLAIKVDQATPRAGAGEVAA